MRSTSQSTLHTPPGTHRARAYDTMVDTPRCATNWHEWLYPGCIEQRIDREKNYQCSIFMLQEG